MTRPPVRGLTVVGRALWDRFLDGAGTITNEAVIELLQIVCEQLDERAVLRRAVFERGEWRDRVALRALDAQFTANLTALIDRTSNDHAAADSTFDDLLAALGDPT